MTTPKPRLHEPELPATARRAPTTLRSGWTTGTCAAAAAKASTLGLLCGTVPSSVEVGLPRSGRRVRFEVTDPIIALHADRRWAQATVIKDAGDDPDVTHGAHLVATVRRCEGAETATYLLGGEGVGVVTLPGLGLTVGQPAINPVPRAQILLAVSEARAQCGHDDTALEVEISVPGGEALARKTTNPRLGIVGGISILGTTGIVRPMSTAAWRASVGQAIDVIAAQGLDTVVLTTGGRTEQAAMALEPHLPEVCFIEVGDFTGYALRRAADRGLTRCVFVGMAGKLAKLGAGVLMTHWTRSRIDPQFLACLTADAGGDAATVAEVATVRTARHAYELWNLRHLHRAAPLLCSAVATNLARHVDGRLAVDVVLVDFDSLQPMGQAHG